MGDAGFQSKDPRIQIRYQKNLDPDHCSSEHNLQEEPLWTTFVVLWIRFGFNAVLDPAFYVSAYPDPGFC
jgi:hypothetical protein